MRHHVSALLRVTIALCALLLLPAPAGADATPDPDEAVDQITQLNRDAITAYQAKKFDDARKLLKQALDLATAAGLDKHAIKARTHIHLGVVIIGGFKQHDLGIKQFKKAIEIQADIGLTKSLITPELQDAFNEAKKGELPPTPPPPPDTTAKTPPPKPAAPPDSLGTGLSHEPVAEGKQGSAISITVGVSDEIEFEKLILAYRPEGAADFLGREMKEVADGKYGAEIPPTATNGGTVAYYIEAEDEKGGPVAARGSVDNPIVIHLLGVGVTKRDDEEEEEEEGEEEGEGPENRLFVGLLAGSGFGYATGTGDTNADVMIDPAGLAASSLVQVAPEIGYWMDSSLMLSMQIRYQYITGPTDIHATNPNRIYHTANYALAVFAKATWKFGGSGSETKFHPFFSLSAGLGRIRHVVSFQRQNLMNCGETRMETCIDTIGAGPVLLGPGGGIMYDIAERVALLVQLNSFLGFPTFSAHLDGNVGVALAF
jgi:hypothetical protein